LPLNLARTRYWWRLFVPYAHRLAFWEEILENQKYLI
jgi:hypothetical protein